MGLAFKTPLEQIPGIGARFSAKLKKLDMRTVGDLLRHFPSRYEDFSHITKINNIAPREECTIEGTVQRIHVRRAWRKRMFIIEAQVEDDTGEVRAVWFNQTYIQNILHEGARVNLSGKVSLSREGELYLSNPNYEVVRYAEQKTKHTGRIVPIYPETRGLTSKGLRYLIQPLLESVKLPPDIIPRKIAEREEFLSFEKALHAVHFPETIEEALTAKRRFAFEDLFLLQLHIAKERKRIAQEKAYRLQTDLNLVKKMVGGLPFELTPSQKKSLWEIIKDMDRSFPMNRLLQGDVGSGKTIIAAITALITAHQKLQTAFMAPTEILARQHYRTITKFFPEYENGVALMTGSESKVYYGHNLETTLKKSELQHEIESGKVRIVIGTHALLQKKVAIPELALVIIDEQHRFGVDQRAHLLRSQKGKRAPHLLSMSATPIPRTLALTVFGDLDLSLITELPKDRKHIITKVIPPTERQKSYEFIRKEISNGRQAFVVCPRIQPSTKDKQLTSTEIEKINIKTVVEEYEKLSKKIFPDLNVEMLHGKIKPPEKERIMKEFAENRIHILIATSVIEVGIDVPNATIMMIEGSERFGLAQLYQFRGRVGRGIHQSYCFLFSESFFPNSIKRLVAIEKAKNGLELAEKDLSQRGSGEFLGTAQTGMPDLAMKALQHPDLVKNTRMYALNIIEKNPSLSNYPELKERLMTFAEEIHGE